MKKLSLIVAGLSVLVGMTVQAADTNAVTSVNIVGLIKTDLPSNQIVFVAVNMNAVGGSNQLFQTLIGDQLPVSSVAYFWNLTSQKWDSATKKTKGWGDYTNKMVSSGSAVFIKSPSNTPLNVLGEVPLAPTTTVTLISGLNALGYAYPVDMFWSNTPFYSGLPVSAVMYVWNVTSQKWDSATKKTKGWGDATNLVLKAGQAFFIMNNAGYTNFLEPRPFTP